MENCPREGTFTTVSLPITTQSHSLLSGILAHIEHENPPSSGVLLSHCSSTGRQKGWLHFLWLGNANCFLLFFGVITKYLYSALLCARHRFKPVKQIISILTVLGGKCYYCFSFYKWGQSTERLGHSVKVTSLVSGRARDFWLLVRFSKIHTWTLTYNSWANMNILAWA